MNRISLIEPQCVDWQHEMVNAGMLELVSSAFPDAKLDLYADAKHCKNIKELSRVETDEHFIVVPDIRGELENIDYYYDLGNKIINESNPDVMILMSSYQSNMEAFYKIAKKHTNIDYVIVVHAIMEWLFSLGKLEKNEFLRKQKRAIQLRKCIKKLAKLDNVIFVSYSPYINQCRKYLGEDTITKFHFLHHPYPSVNVIGHTLTDSHCTVGVLGACINDKAEEIMKQTEEYIDYKLFNKNEKITRDAIVSMLSEVDCLLIPYDRKQYRVSASGVLFDAINYGVPIVGLDSPIIEYYVSRYDIGACFKSLLGLESALNDCSLKETLGKKRTNVLLTRRTLREENIEMINKMI